MRNLCVLVVKSEVTLPYFACFLISDNLYNKEKVLEIFESFQSIAEMVLLFLTSVESIELYRRKHGQVS